MNWPDLERSAKHRVLKILFGGFALDGRTLVARSGTPLELFRAG